MAYSLEIQASIALLSVGIGFAIWTFQVSFTTSSNQPRTVPGVPLLGVALQLTPNKIINFFTTCYEKYGKVYQFYAFGTRYIVISDISLVREILLKRPKTFRRTRKFEEVFKTTRTSEGLFGAEGQLWSKLRRHNAPSFSKRNVELMLGAIFDETNQLVEKFKL